MATSISPSAPQMRRIFSAFLVVGITDDLRNEIRQEFETNPNDGDFQEKGKSITKHVSYEQERKNAHESGRMTIDDDFNTLDVQM
jgi:hypothetical protein